MDRLNTSNLDNESIFVVCRTGDSGVTDYSICLILELQRRFNVEFITAESALRHPLNSKVKIVPVFRRFRHLFIDYFSLLGLVLRRKPKLVFLQSWIGFPLIDALLVRVIRVFGIQTAVTVHDIVPHHPTLFSRHTVRFFFRSFDKVVVHSSESRTKLLAMGVKVPILVVPHGEYSIFNLDQLNKSSARAILNENNEDFPDDTFVALFFGHLDERKGLKEFLLAATDISLSSMRFVVAGRNDLSPVYQHLLEKKWPSNIRLDVGHVPFEKVQAYFAAADVVVTPYREGTTSGVLKIAMAFGKPVIGSAVGDMAEALGDWPGILISPTNIKSELVSALTRMSAEREIYTEEACMSHDKYSWKTIGAAYVNFLDANPSI